MAWAPGSAAADSCPQGGFTAVGSAAGIRAVQSAPGLALVSDADSNLPGSQAQIGTTSGSVAWAGAPYSGAVAENAGAAGADANQVPVFAVSRYPTTPAARQSTPPASLEATTGAASAAARVVSSGDESDVFAMGRVSTTAATSCDDKGAVQAKAATENDLVAVRDILRMGSIRSTAEASRDPNGRLVLSGSLEIEGATVLGQGVTVNDTGVHLGTSSTAVPGASVAGPLSDAGITVRYLQVVKDETRGEVIAPGIEVVIEREVRNVGTGPVRTVLTFGRAHAAVFATPAEASAVSAAPAPTPETAAPAVASSDVPQAGDGRLAISSPPVSRRPSRNIVAMLNLRAPIGELYSAMAIAGLVLASLSILLEKRGSPWRNR